MALVPPAPRWVRCCIALSVVAAAAIPSLTCSGRLPAQAGRPDTPSVRREPFERRLLLSGELVAERAIDLRAPDVGVKPLEIRRMVDSGTPVKAGDLLMAFDNSELAAGLEQQRITVLSARTGLVTAESQSGASAAAAEFELQRRQADLEEARIDAAIPPGLKSVEEYQRLQLELHKAESRLVDAQKALAAARSVGGSQEQLQQLALGKSETELARLEASIARLQIVAPSAGVVLIGTNNHEDRRWRVGDAAYPGEQMVTLPDPETMIVRARLYDVDDALIHAGAPAAVILDSFPDTVFAARIRHIDSMALQWEERSSSRIFWVTIDFMKLDLGKMRPGMSAQVVVARSGDSGGEDRPNVPAEAAAAARTGDPLVAPRSSLDLGDLERPRLLLADGSWREVDLGPCDALRCVIDGGVEEGTRLGWVAGRGQ